MGECSYNNGSSEVQHNTSPSVFVGLSFCDYELTSVQIHPRKVASCTALEPCQYQKHKTTNHQYILFASFLVLEPTL